MGKSSAPKIGVSPSEAAQANNIQYLQENVQKPIINDVLPKALPALSQAFDTTLSTPDRQNIEDQYTQAHNEVLNNAGARGGMLQKGLKDVMIGRASDVGAAQNAARQTGIQRALGLMPAGFPGADSTLSAAGQLAQTGAQRNAANASLAFQQNQANRQSMSSSLGGLGSLISLFM